MTPTPRPRSGPPAAFIAAALVALALLAPPICAWINGALFTPRAQAQALTEQAFTSWLLPADEGALPSYGEIRRRALRLNAVEGRSLHLVRVARADGTELVAEQAPAASTSRVVAQANGFEATYAHLPRTLTRTVRQGATWPALLASLALWAAAAVGLVVSDRRRREVHEADAHTRALQAYQPDADKIAAASGVPPVGDAQDEALRQALDPHVTAHFWWLMGDDARLTPLIHGAGHPDAYQDVVGYVRETRALLDVADTKQPRPVPQEIIAGVRGYLREVDLWLAGRVGERGLPFQDPPFRDEHAVPFKRLIRVNDDTLLGPSTSLRALVADAIDAETGRSKSPPASVDWSGYKARADFNVHTGEVRKALAVIVESMFKHGLGHPLRVRIEKGEQAVAGRAFKTFTLRIEHPDSRLIDRPPAEFIEGAGSKIRRARTHLAGHASHHVVAPLRDGGPVRYDLVRDRESGPLADGDDPRAFAHVVTFYHLPR